VTGEHERARTIINREVCVGELDPITPVAAAREIADALPDGGARLEVVEGAGHFTWKDAPDRYWPLHLSS
jgi:pimeloyl-ACP methyl ester carboxylesterase